MAIRAAVSNVIELRVRFGETDAMGIVWYPRILGWFDHANHELFRSLDQPLAELLAETGISVPIIEAEARFLGPVRAGEVVVVETRVAEIRRRSFSLEHTVRVGERPVAKGREIRLFARLESADPPSLEQVEPPEELVRALAGWVELSA
jgi:YbgC/YbaW family acyl-CoA thioester hydrolase